MRKQHPIYRFLEKIRVNSETGCWIWTGANSGTGRGGGYGRFSISSQTVAAHRWSYTHFKGLIKRGFTIDHKCKNRACVAPHHLEQVTNTENQRRKFRPVSPLAGRSGVQLPAQPGPRAQIGDGHVQEAVA